MSGALSLIGSRPTRKFWADPSALVMSAAKVEIFRLLTDLCNSPFP